MDEVIKRSLEKGVFMITVGTQKDTSKKGLEVAEKYDGLWATVGLHPNHLTEQEFWDDDELPADKQATPKIKTRAEVFDTAYYADLAKHPKCVAIGETGLDWYRIPENADLESVKQLQRDIVNAHIDVATEADLPIIIHCRDAYAEQADLLKAAIDEGKLSRRGVIHCFTGTLEEAQRFIDLGFFISFTGIVTFPARKSDELIEGLPPLASVAKRIPLESMMIETDSPYLTPLPHRGERNEPAYVEHVAKFIAELKSVELSEVAEVTTRNAKTLFGI